jgi:hypothetical protein
MAIYKNTPPIVTNGLVLHLDAGSRKSYVSGSTTWSDLSGNNYTGSLINGPTFNAAEQGSIVFNNASSQYINHGNIVNPGTGNFTLAVWIKTTSSGFNGWIGKARATGAVGRFAIFQDSSTPGKPSCIIDYGVGGIVAVGVTSINDNKWHYITQVANRTSTMTIYVDGRPENSISISAGSAVNLNLSDSFYLATYPNAAGTPANFANGSIASAQYYNRALSATEVAQNYNALKSRFGY